MTGTIPVPAEDAQPGKGIAVLMMIGNGSGESGRAGHVQAL